MKLLNNIAMVRIEDHSDRSETKSYYILRDWLDRYYPEIGITFGCVGQIGPGYGTYEDCSWFFFTKVWDHRVNRSYDNCHSYFVGQSLNMEQRVIDGDLSYLGNSLVYWINNTVLPDLGKPCTRTKGKQGW